MHTISKPDIEDWPDQINMKLNGVPIIINYEQQEILVPDEADYRNDNLARYLVDEGFITIEGN